MRTHDKKPTTYDTPRGPVAIPYYSGTDPYADYMTTAEMCELVLCMAYAACDSIADAHDFYYSVVKEIDRRGTIGAIMSNRIYAREAGDKW